MLHQFRGDPAAVRELAAEALTIAVEHRFAFWQAGATVLLGWATAASAAKETVSGATDGPAVLQQGIEAWRATGSATYRTYSLTLHADALRLCGRPEEALAALDQAEASIAETAERLCEPEMHRLRGELLRASAPIAPRRRSAAPRDGGRAECVLTPAPRPWASASSSESADATTKRGRWSRGRLRSVRVSETRRN